ncbi:MAG: bacterial transcriptional activator domain-containing protein, partial [Gemmatimonas sp.]
PVRDGFFLRESAEFDSWVEVERQLLRTQALDAVARLVALARQHNQLDRAIHWAQCGARMDAYDIGSMRLLLEALRDSGDRVGAARTFEAYAARLGADLSVEAPAELREIAYATPSMSPAPQQSSSSRSAVAPAGSMKDHGRESIAVAPAVPDPMATRPSSRWARYGGVAAMCIVGILAAVSMVSMALRPQPLAGRVHIESLTFGRDTTLAPVSSSALLEIRRKVAESGMSETPPLPGTSNDGTSNDVRRKQARTLRADAVISGTVSRFSDSVRVQLTISDAFGRRASRSLDMTASGTSYERMIQSLSDQAVAQLAFRIHPELSSWADSASQPTRVDAYRAFLEGRLLTLVPNAETATRGIERLLDAWRIDTTWTVPLAYAALANAEAGRVTSVDTILDRMGTRRGHELRMDRGLFDFAEALAHGANYQAYVEARRLALMAPLVEWRFRRAQWATRIGRPIESLSVFASIPDSSCRRFDADTPFPSCAFARAEANHKLARYETELTEIRDAR